MSKSVAVASPARLNAQAIVEAGLALLDAEGLDGLSLKRIADHFGVKTPALYWHLRNRAALEGLMVEAMLREALALIAPNVVGWAWLLEFGRSLRAIHRRHRDAARLIAIATPSPALAGELMEAVVDAVAAGGIDHARAAQAQAAVQSFTLGWSLFEANRPIDALMMRMMDVDAAFETGLAALVHGFQHEQPSWTRSP